MTATLKRACLAVGALLITAGIATAVAAGTSGQALAPAAMAAPLVQGTDVSNLSTILSWPAVKAGGMSFVGVLAYDGATVGNPHYNSEVTGALSAGLFVMPYVLADPLKISGADEFDKRAWPVIKGVAAAPYGPGGKYLPVALDLEAQPQVTTNACYGLSAARMVGWITAFIMAARAQPRVPVPVIYTTASWWKQCTGNSTAFGADPLWVADYGVPVPVLPAGWSGYTFWQSSGGATVNGIAGTSAADLDQLEGTVAGTAGTSGTFQVQTLSSLAGQHVSYLPAALPKGVTLSGSGTLSWTKTTPVGAFPITVYASGQAVPAAVSFALRLHGAIGVLTAARATTAGSPVSLHVSTAGPDQRIGFPATLSATGLPPGLSMTRAGLITGWAAKPGSYTVRVGASDALGGSGSVTFPWTVKAAGAAGTTGLVRQGGGTAKCLDDPAGAAANGTPVDLSACTGRGNQNWTVVQDGTVRIGNSRTGGKCLDVTGGSTATGAKLQLYTCDSGDLGQVWKAAADSQLVNVKSGKCLAVPVTRAGNGTRPVIAPCANSTSQVSEHWLRPAAPVLSGAPGKCIAAAGAAAVLVRCANTTAQHWQAAPDGTLRAGGKCLAASGTSARSALSVVACPGAASAQWKLVTKNAVASEIASAASGLCVTAPSDGTQLVVAACADTAVGTWQIG